MRYRKHASFVAATCLAAALSIGLSGCGSGESATQSSESSTSVQAQTKSETASIANSTSTSAAAITKSPLVLGTKSETSVEVQLTNGLSKGVTAFCLSEAGAEEYGENLLTEASIIAANEEAILYASPNDAEANFDIRVRLEGSDEYVEFVNVPLATSSSVTLKSADGSYFVDYVAADGTKGSTKEDAASTSTGDNDSETIAPQSDNAAGQQEYTEPVAETYETVQTYEEPVVETYEEPSYEPVAEPVVEEAPVVVVEEAAPEQSSDACQGDVLLR